MCTYVAVPKKRVEFENIDNMPIKVLLILNRFAGINSVSDGISGSVAYAAPALVSNTWFPPNQRATATALGTFFVFMGIGMSFILGKN